MSISNTSSNVFISNLLKLLLCRLVSGDIDNVSDESTVKSINTDTVRGTESVCIRVSVLSGLNLEKL